MSLKATSGNDAKWTSRGWIFCNMCSGRTSSLTPCTFHRYFFYFFFPLEDPWCWLVKEPSVSTSISLSTGPTHWTTLTRKSNEQAGLEGVRSIQLSTNVPVNKHPNSLKWPEVREWLQGTDRCLTPPGPLHQQEWLVPVDTSELAQALTSSAEEQLHRRGWAQSNSAEIRDIFHGNLERWNISRYSRLNAWDFWGFFILWNLSKCKKI